MYVYGHKHDEGLAGTKSLNSRVVGSLTFSRVSWLKYSIYTRQPVVKLKTTATAALTDTRKVSRYPPIRPWPRRYPVTPSRLVPTFLKRFVFVTHSCRSSVRPVLRRRSRSTTNTPPPRAGPVCWYVSSSCSALRCPTVCGAKTFLIVSAPPFPRYIPDDPLCVRLDFN